MNPQQCKNPEGNAITLAKMDTPRVAIIGSGHSGIAAAYYLKKAGIENFLIFESLPDFGGTWYENRYPGVEVDTPSHLYTYTFSAYDWSHRYADQRQLLDYQNRTVDKIGIRSNLRPNTEVSEIEWDDERKLWQINFTDGRSAEFEHVISAVGFLNVPGIPDYVDVDAYPGIVVHTAKWNPEIDWSNKRIGIIGTGASAVSVVSEVAKTAAHVIIFQRSPNWIIPKGQRAFSDIERARLRIERNYWIKFLQEYWNYEKVKIFGNHEQPGTRTNKRLQKICEDYLEKQLDGRDDLKTLLRPDYPFYGKRPVLSDTYYRAVRQENVSFAPAASRVGADGVVDVDGNKHDLDIVVLATGYRAADYLARLKVKGLNGHYLHAVWGMEPQAYLGSVVPGFPNFFMMYGPNSNAGPVVFMLEVQAKFAADSIRAAYKKKKSMVEVSATATRMYNIWLQKRLESSVYKSTKNYFAAPTGRIVTQWPFSASKFWFIARASRGFVMKTR